MIVHGDHGSRITSGEPRPGASDLMRPADFAHFYSTLLAVRAPGIRPGVDTTVVDVADMLRHLTGASFENADVRADSLPSVFACADRRGCELLTCVPLPAFWRVDSSARMKTRRRVNSDPTFAPTRRLAGRARSRQAGACPERGEL